MAQETSFFRNFFYLETSSIRKRQREEEDGGGRDSYYCYLPKEIRYTLNLNWIKAYFPFFSHFFVSYISFKNKLDKNRDHINKHVCTYQGQVVISLQLRPNLCVKDKCKSFKAVLQDFRIEITDKQYHTRTNLSLRMCGFRAF